MKREALEDYCKKNSINIPTGASKPMLERLIVRAFLHNKTLKQDSCFGFWEQDDNNCLTCSFEPHCFKASLGMEKETYFKKLDNQKIRIVSTMTPKRR